MRKSHGGKGEGCFASGDIILGAALLRAANPISSRPLRPGVCCVAMNEELKPIRLDTEPPPAVIAGVSAKEASDLLFRLLLEVVRRHQPEIEPVLLGGANISGFTPELMARALQAQGILFQLLAIAEQNAAMRRRRHIERTRGRAALRGTFDHVLAEAAAEGIDPSSPPR